MACPVHCHLFRSPWGCRAKSWLLCKSTLGFLAWYQGNSYHSPAHSVSTAAATMCTNKLTERITYLSHPIGTVWQPNTVHSHLGIRHINWTSVRLKFMLNPLVSWKCPNGRSSGSPVDPQNPEHNWNWNHLHCIPKNPLRMQWYGHISVFARWHTFDEIELSWRGWLSLLTTIWFGHPARWRLW